MNPNQNKPNQTKRWLSFVFLMGVIPAESLAQAGTCQTTALRTADNKRIEYKVNTGNMPNGITADNGIYAVIRSADLWNEQSNSSTFRYIGSTTETSLPALYSDCVSQNKLYSIVIFAQASGSFGLNTRKCIDGNSVSHAAEIRTYRQNMAGTAYPWGVGDLGAGQWDLIHNIAHELGHSLQINHPMKVKRP